MKVKQRPPDFQVEERTDVVPGPHGAFALYRLEKENWTTPDAVAAIGRRWKLDRRRVSFAGLKDRHARTTQFLTIQRGPERNLSQNGLTLTFLGKVDRPYVSDDIVANRFRITLRDLSTDSATRIVDTLPEVAAVGVPNYFGDQRFGSVTDDNAFIAREMVLGNFEAALRLALLSRTEFDRPEERREKEILANHWGKWSAAANALPRGHGRAIAEFLAHRPDDFRGACARLRPELQGLYLAAWQSHLWNRMLARWLTDRVPANDLFPVDLKTGPVVMPRIVPVGWAELSLPLPSARLKFDAQAPWADVVQAILAEEGIPLAEMKIKGMREPFFSKGDRLGRIPVSEPSAVAGDDELHPGRRQLTLSFELPRGCYATMVVKRLTAVN